MQTRSIVVVVATTAWVYAAKFFLSSKFHVNDVENTERVIDDFVEFATSVNYPLRDLAGPRGRALQAALYHVPLSSSFENGDIKSFSDDRWAVATCTELETADISACVRLLTGNTNPLRSQSIVRMLAFLRRLRSSLLQNDFSSRTSTHRAASSVVVVGGGPAGLVSGLAAVQAGCDVLLLERRTAYERSVWFDLSTDDTDPDGSSSKAYLQSGSVGDGLGGVGPTQALLKSWGFGYQRAQVQRQSEAADERSPSSTAESRIMGSCDASSDWATSRVVACHDAGNVGEDAKSAPVSEIVTVRCAELESFLAKVLFLAGATLAFGVEGHGPCLASSSTIRYDNCGTSTSDSTHEAWTVVATARRDSEHWIVRQRGKDSFLASAGFLESTLAFAARTPCEILRAAETDKRTHERAENLGGGAQMCGDDEGDGFEVLTTPPFDVLVGADGAKSRVRASLNCSMHSVSTFQVPMPRSSQQSDNSQILEVSVGDVLRFPTAILRFATDAATGRCPQLRSDTNSDPFAVRVAVPEVTSVFKRFFHGHCELQVAFDATAAASFVSSEEILGDRAVAQVGASAKSNTTGPASTVLPLPWPLLVPVCNFLFEEPFADELSLRRRLLRCGGCSAKGNATVTTCGAAMHIMPIRRVGPAAVVPLTGSKNDEAHSDTASAVAILVGDSAVTALYRLGVGVNSIFAGLADLRRAFVRGRLVREAATTNRGADKRFLAAWEQNFAPVYAKRLWRASNAQAAAAFWESTCGLVVFQDELWRLLLPAGGAQNKAVQYEGPLSPLDALEYCSSPSAGKLWSWRLY